MMRYHNGYYPQIGDQIVMVDNSGGYQRDIPTGTIETVTDINPDGDSINTSSTTYIFIRRWDLIQRSDGKLAKDCDKDAKPAFNGRVIRD